MIPQGNPSNQQFDPDLVYLESLHITANDTTPTLLDTLNRLFEIVYTTPGHTTVDQWHKSLYAASLLATSADVLRLRSIDPLSHLPNTSRPIGAEILANPIEWSSIQILLAPGGEQQLGQILKTFDLMQIDEADRRQFLQRVLSAIGKRELLNDIGLQNAELRMRAESLRVLDLIQLEKEEEQQLRMIDNLIWFRDDVNLTMGHLLEILLVTQDDLKHYSTSCLVLGGFVQTMKHIDYRKVFWKHLCNMIENDRDDQNAKLFHKSCQLISFYESILDHIVEYLGSVCRMELGNGDVEWIGNHLEFHQVRRIVCLMLASSSGVRQRFADQLNEFGLSMELRCDLFQFWLCE